MINVYIGFLITLYGLYDFYETISNQGDRDIYSNSRNYGTSIFLIVLGFALLFDIIEF